jgi:hypothetical protein
MMAQRCGNQIQFIRKRLPRHNSHPGSLQRPANRRSGEVDLLPPRAAVANRQHNGANIGRKTLSHAPSLRVSTKVSEVSPQSLRQPNRHQK